MAYPAPPFHLHFKDVSVFDTIHWISKLARDFTNSPVVVNTANVCRQFSPDTSSYLKCVFDFVIYHVDYEMDEEGDEVVRTPDLLLKGGKGDCKKMSTFIGSVLLNQGIEHFYKVVSYDKVFDGTSMVDKWEHIYVIVPLQDGTYITLDPVNDKQFNQEVEYDESMLFDLNGKQVDLHVMGNQRRPSWGSNFANYTTHQDSAFAVGQQPQWGSNFANYTTHQDSAFAVGMNHSIGQGPEIHCSDFTTKSGCEDSAAQGGPDNCGWYMPQGECDSYGRPVAVPIFQKPSPIIPPYMPYRPPAGPQIPMRVPRGFVEGSVSLDEDVSLSGLLRIGPDRWANKMGKEGAWYVFLPMLLLKKYGGKFLTSEIPSQQRQKLSYIIGFIEAHKRQGDTEEMVIMDGIYRGIKESQGADPYDIIEAFKTTEVPISGGDVSAMSGMPMAACPNQYRGYNNQNQMGIAPVILAGIIAGVAALIPAISKLLKAIKNIVPGWRKDYISAAPAMIFTDADWKSVLNVQPSGGAYIRSPWLYQYKPGGNYMQSQFYWIDNQGRAHQMPTGTSTRPQAINVTIISQVLAHFGYLLKDFTHSNSPPPNIGTAAPPGADQIISFINSLGGMQPPPDQPGDAPIQGTQPPVYFPPSNGNGNGNGAPTTGKGAAIVIPLALLALFAS